MGAVCEHRIGKTGASLFEEAVAAIKEHATGQLEAVLRRGSMHVIQCVDGAGRSLLHWAVMSGTEDALEVLLTHISVCQHDSRQSPSADAANKDDKVLQLILASDVASNKSPLAMAISAGAAMKVYILVKHAPMAIVWTAHGCEDCAIQTALNMCRSPAATGASEVLNAMLVGVIESRISSATLLTARLLSSGAAVDTWAPSGLSALMSASSTNQVEVMAILMTGRDAQNSNSAPQRVSGAAADLDLADAQGRTALMHAVMNDCVEAVELLLTHNARVHAADVSGKEAIDLCDPGREVAQLLASHMSGLKSRAEAEAVKGLEEEPQSNPCSEVHGTDKNKKVGRSFQAPEGVLLRAEISYAAAEGHTDAIAAYDSSYKEKEEAGRDGRETHGRRTTCTIGADPVLIDRLAAANVSAVPCDHDVAGPWQLAETNAVQCQRWPASNTHGRLSHSEQTMGDTAAESQVQHSQESAMSTFKQLFYVRDCSAATQWPSSRTPDPSFPGCKKDVDSVEQGSQPVDTAVAQGGITSMEGHTSHSHSAYGASWVRGGPENQWNNGNAPKESPSYTRQVATASQQLGVPNSSLVADLAAQVVFLQKKVDAMETQHKRDTHEAILETVQQMEARLMPGCANVAAQLTWHELHRTGLAAIYCGINQGSVQPDALQAAIRQCLSSTSRHASFPRMHQGPAPPPPPPPRPPPSQRCSAPQGTVQPPMMMQPPSLAPSLPPQPPGPPPQPPLFAQAGGRGMLDVRATNAAPMSPLSQSRFASSGAFSAHAKPFSPLACEWNCPNSIWAMSSPDAVRPLPVGESAVDGGGAAFRPRNSSGVSLLPSDLHLPDSLPGSTVDPSVNQRAG